MSLFTAFIIVAIIGLVPIGLGLYDCIHLGRYGIGAGLLVTGAVVVVIGAISAISLKTSIPLAPEEIERHEVISGYIVDFSADEITLMTDPTKPLTTFPLSAEQYESLNSRDCLPNQTVTATGTAYQGDFTPDHLYLVLSSRTPTLATVEHAQKYYDFSWGVITSVIFIVMFVMAIATIPVEDDPALKTGTVVLVVVLICVLILDLVSIDQTLAHIGTYTENSLAMDTEGTAYVVEAIDPEKQKVELIDDIGGHSIHFTHPLGTYASLLEVGDTVILIEEGSNIVELHIAID